MLAVPLNIISEDDDYLVVDKPAGLQVHSGGSFHHNTIVGQLERQGRGALWVVHRLDRVTSGVLVLAKTKARAN